MTRASKLTLLMLVFAWTTLARAATSPVGIDFSFAGYGGGGVALPGPSPTLRVNPTGQDDTRLLQAAIDQIASRPVGADGIRGTILLGPSSFNVQGQLRISTGGIILRGSSTNGTKIIATGVDRRTLIEIKPAKKPTTGPAIEVTEDAAAGATVLTLADVSALAANDRIVITRRCTDAWIAALKMNTFPGNYANMRITWLPGSREIVWDRQIISVDASKKQITLDVPITTALEKQFGLGMVSKVTSESPITNVGIEQMTLESAVDPTRPKDEDHSWIALAMDGVEDAWVRSVTAIHFAGSGFYVGPRARRVTVESCRCEAPVSEPGGWRRWNFRVEGQQVLVHSCYSESGINDFASGLCAGGPNVFFDCASKDSLGASGSIESWSSGVLYERVKIDGADLRLTYDMARTQGAGWTAANSVIWNCTARSIEAKGPDGAPNIASDSKEPLYESLLKARGISRSVPSKVAILQTPPVPLFQWQESKEATAPPIHSVKIVGGRYVVDNHLLWGGQIVEGWWRGQATPNSAPTASGLELTRWIPGRKGPSLTENLPDLAARMVAQGTPFMNSWPGLWYDRRRDEHSQTRREDTNVWAPFSEMPWARSGENETAYDGLSKFDLTKFNPWYYSRLKQFAQLASQNGLVLYHFMYNTHNVLEILPHYMDYPWRPLNNINETGLPEPPYQSVPRGDRFRQGNFFYSVDNPSLRQLHRNFIMHELDELGDQPNVIFATAFQFVGPLPFQQFFMDTVAEWEKAHNRKVRLAIWSTKDITDAILKDPIRGKQIEAVDLRYWQYRPEGNLIAPLGGRNLAFREMIRETFPGVQDTPPETTPEQAYKQVREYRDKYPNLALIAPTNGVGSVPSLMAGAAQVLSGAQPIDKWINSELGGVLMNMSPRDGAAQNAWSLADQGMKHLLLYSIQGPSITADLSMGGYSGMWVNPTTGATQPLAKPSQGSGIAKPDDQAWLLYLKMN